MPKYIFIHETLGGDEPPPDVGVGVGRRVVHVTIQRTGVAGAIIVIAANVADVTGTGVQIPVVPRGIIYCPIVKSVVKFNHADSQIIVM
jgi:hypothetical protein